MRAARTLSTLGGRRRRERGDASVVAGLAVDRSLFDERADELLDEERIAFAAVLDLRRQVVERGVPAEQFVDEQFAGDVVEGRQRDRPAMGGGEPRAGVAGAVGDHQQRAGSGDRLDQLVEEVLAGVVHPVDVLDQMDGRLQVAASVHHVADQPDDAGATGVGIDLERAAAGSGEAHEVAHQLGSLGDRRPEPGECACDLLAGPVRRGVDAGPEQRPQELEDRPERPHPPECGDAGAEDPQIAGVAEVDELLAEPGLADAGIADELEHLAVTPQRGGERILELGELGLATHERGPLAPPGGLVAGPGAGEALEGEHADRSLGSLDLGWGELVECELVGDELGGPLGEVDAAGARERLDALGEADRMADHLGGAAASAEMADDDLAGVDAHADAESGRVTVGEDVAEALERPAQLERREAGPAGVILGGPAGAEEDEGAVAGELVDDAAERVDGLLDRRRGSRRRRWPSCRMRGPRRGPSTRRRRRTAR